MQNRQQWLHTMIVLDLIVMGQYNSHRPSTAERLMTMINNFSEG